MSRFSTLINKITSEQRRFYLTEMGGEPWYRRAFYAVICFCSVLVSEINSMRLFVRVASGTYTTMLALIPFTVVGGSLIITFNKEANVDTLTAKIREFVIPVAGDTIGGFLSESLKRTLDLGLGPVGIISLFITSVMLFVYIEDCVNDIWHVVKPRAFYLRILLFYAVVTMGPVLLSYSIFQATQLIPDLLMQGFVWKIVREIGVVFLVLLVVYKFLPNTRVQIKYAMIPAFVGALLIEVLKFAFGLYFSLAFSSSSYSNYRILYGALGIIPVMLLWLYVTWAIVLVGVEMSYCLQNMRLLLLRKIYDTSSDENPWVFLGAYAPIEVVASMVRNLCAGKDPQTAEELAVECVYPVLAIEAIMKRLENMHVVKSIQGETAVSYILSKPLDGILIRDIMEAFDESSPRVLKHPRLSAMVEELLLSQNRVWKDSDCNILRENEEEHETSETGEENGSSELPVASDDESQMDLHVDGL